MKFKIFSIDFRISYTFLCLVAICLITGLFNGFLCCIFAVIIHETGHIVPMYRFSSLPQKVEISLFEISITGKLRHQSSFKQNVIIIFCGPLANFVCFILFYLLYLFYGSLFEALAYANLSIGLFNLLPVMSLDGGQLIYLLLRCRFSDGISEKCVNIITFIILFPLAALGFLILFNSKYNFSLLLVCLYIIISLICRNNKYY